MEEVINQYAEGILAAAGGVVMMGILTDVFLGQESGFIQFIEAIINSSV